MIPLTTKLPAICSLLRRVLEMEKEATPAPWEASKVDDIGGASIYGDMLSPTKQNQRLVASGTWTNKEEERPQIVRPISVEECDANTALIALSRNITKPQATALLASIESLIKVEESVYSHSLVKANAWRALQSIADAFPDALFQDSSWCA